ncbi:zinc ribbon domain-containing protein [Candidatus Bathyarchaeota archaeon]|nr:MAG: zinc ribbon domain-containing protein [Candidatus Bathyarchaeota archaeon]
MVKTNSIDCAFYIVGAVAELNIGAWIVVPPPFLQRYLSCPRCGRRVSIVSNYCNFCGVLLRPESVWAFASRICSKCKSRIPFVARFCPECGQKQ